MSQTQSQNPFPGVNPASQQGTHIPTSNGSPGIDGGIIGAPDAVNYDDPFFASFLEDDPAAGVAAQVQQGGQTQPQAPQQLQPAVQPGGQPQFQAPAQSAAPDNYAALARAEVQRALAEQAQQGRPKGAKTKIDPAFDAAAIQLTPEEEQAIGGAAGRAILAKLVRGELNQYDQSRIVPQFETQAARDARLAQQEQTLRSETTAQVLSARVPDIAQITSQPQYRQFASELVFDPSSPVPIPRGEILARAYNSGNVEYVVHEMNQYRQRMGQQPAQQGAPQQMQQSPVAQYQPQPQQNAPAQGMVPGYPAPAGVGVGPQGVLPPSGQSVPPTLANLQDRPRRVRTQEAEAKMMEYARQMQSDPHNMEARVGYEKLYSLLRSVRSASRRV